MEKVNKWMVLMITGAVAAIAFLLLPFLSFDSLSFNILDLFEDAEMIFILFAILTIASAIGVAAGGYKKDRKIALICSIVNVVSFFLTAGTIQNRSGIEVVDYAGIGFWIALIAGIASIVFAVKAKED